MAERTIYTCDACDGEVARAAYLKPVVVTIGEMGPMSVDACESCRTRFNQFFAVVECPASTRSR